jgi:hypothetical protein
MSTTSTPPSNSLVSSPILAPASPPGLPIPPPLELTIPPATDQDIPALEAPGDDVTLDSLLERCALNPPRYHWTPGRLALEEDFRLWCLKPTTSLVDIEQVVDSLLEGCNRVIRHDSTPPITPPPNPYPPPSFAPYDPANINHSKYVKPIWLTPQGPPQLPEYISFTHDFDKHQHSVLGVHPEANPPETPYGWGLEAVPFIGPTWSPEVVDDEALGVFDVRYIGSREIDVAIHAINNWGVVADVDRY